MSSTLHEILWKNKAEDASASQLQDGEDVQLKQQEAQEEDAAERRGGTD